METAKKRKAREQRIRNTVHREMIEGLSIRLRVPGINVSSVLKYQVTKLKKTTGSRYTVSDVRNLFKGRMGVSVEAYRKNNPLKLKPEPKF